MSANHLVDTILSTVYLLGLILVDSRGFDDPRGLANDRFERPTRVKTTPFHPFHLAHGARMIDFGGWDMPILYRSILAEHHHTRKRASLFDVSHMGRLVFTGSGAASFLDRICTRPIASAKVGQCRYGLVLNDQAGTLDDIIVSKADDHFLVVCNAGNREKIVTWCETHRTGNVQFEDRTLSTAMLAVQGPEAIGLLMNKIPLSAKDLKRYHFTIQSCDGVKYCVSRTGYTGEDGVELIFSAEHAETVWKKLVDDPQAEESGIRPAGLGARDSLRLEAAMCLYGHELNEQIDPLSAGLAWCVDLDKEFIGAGALRHIAQAGPKRKLVGLELEGKRIARQDAIVLSGDQPVGTVTSGCLSPTLGKSIALTYVSAELAQAGTRLVVDLRGRLVNAVVVVLPFYKRT